MKDYLILPSIIDKSVRHKYIIYSVNLLQYFTHLISYNEKELYPVYAKKAWKVTITKKIIYIFTKPGSFLLL